MILLLNLMVKCLLFVFYLIFNLIFLEILIDNLNKIPSKTNAFNKQADIGVLPKKETSTVLETLSPLKQNTEQVLSAEALRILTELPNLSMMRQKFQIKVDHLQHYQPMSNNN